ncbi:MAG: peptidase U32 [Puniceicoccaceae bacterium 5H]|nr:MAG: peptidase U32 [Puniceicoccaceae bacterium 5H]
MRVPEVLAPAGNWDCARAAVENGADAIFFGLNRFNARMRADNFTEADLPELMAYLHRRGVKGYLTFNTLIFADELEEAEDFLRSAIAAGVDAAIVQDVGICRLIRRVSPDFPIHASTQMSVSSDAGVEFARELGASVVVVARECSIAEIEKMQATLKDRQMQVPLEVFVHGALCVAYSGQCLTSEALGGRSANRGECAQACRLPYELVADGELLDLGDRKYLLSPQDLAGVEMIPELIKAGVASLKIEGRLKRPEYVASITRVYRQTVDRAVEAFQAQRTAEATADERYELEMAFSRGLYTGWLGGIDNQRLVHGRFAKKRGFFLGEVTEVRAQRVAVKGVSRVQTQDGVVFDLGRPEAGETGARVQAVEQKGGVTWLTFHGMDLDWQLVQPGAKVWKTSDPALDKRLRQSFQTEQPNYRRPLRWSVFGHEGGPLVLEGRDERGHVVRESSALPLEMAQKQPLDQARLEKQLGRLGDSPFTQAEVDNQLDPGLILPVSELNRLRRAVVERLLELRAQAPRWQIQPEPVMPQVRYQHQPQDAVTPELVLVVRDLDQLHAALPLAHRDIYAEFEDPKRFRDAMAAVREHRAQTGRDVQLWVMPPRMFKMGEDYVLRISRSAQPDGYLARNHEHLRALTGERLRGDFSLNVSNPLTADYLRERYGLETLTASYDLNVGQLTALLERTPPEWFEVTIHQHMPLFHMEHCVFCTFLSSGKDYRDCGRPCEKQRVHLRDRTGAEHLLRADAGCRNTLFNARTQTGAEFVPHLLDLGVRRFRVEFIDEGPQVIRETVHRYERLLRGEIDGETLWRELNLVSQLGVTRGTLGSTGVRVQ